MLVEPRRFGLDVAPFEVDPLRALGLYWAVTGTWALVDMRSFELITGPKTDRWLVQSFGALVGATGVGLLTARGPAGRRASARIGALGALAIAACEIVFVKRRQIRPVYLADAVVEVSLVAAMMMASGPRATKRPTVTD